MEEKLNVHQFQWTDEAIQRFWNTMYQYPNAIGIAGAHGRVMIRRIKKYVSLESKKILDFGAGHGYLIDEVLKQTKKTEVAGYDYSETAVNHTNNRFKNEPRYVGSYTLENYRNGTGAFDVILMTEVLEHITEKNIDKTFEIIGALMKSRGRLIITVPNNEDVEARKVFCPECGCLFHPVQHQQGFTKESLAALMKKYGFETEMIKPVGFIENNNANAIVKNIFLLFNPKKKSNLLGVFRLIK